MPSPRFRARRRGPHTYDVVDTWTDTHTCRLFVGVNARELADTEAVRRNTDNWTP